MKAFALSLAFVLHATGLWAHTDPVAREHLTNQAMGQAANAANVSTSADIPKLVGLPLRQRDIPLDTSAKNVFSVDTETMLPLYSKNPDAKVPIASITKTVTVITFLQRHNLNEVVTIKKLPQYGPEDETIGLVEGDKLSVRFLIQAALIQSANDAADALALWDAGTTTKFASHMNEALKEWGITGSHFASPSGLQDTNNYATASDLAKIGKLILTNQFVKATVKTKTATITTEQNHSYQLNNTNALLENGLLYGIKTGYTLASGECFLGITTVNGHEVITVILGSNDRFGDTVRLINWIGSSYQWL